ncbi:MAG: ABC transporter permease [Caldiserica bacterium]|nr:MAG: ABC transporter permease [Caldisericota bacterium]RLD14448.1 MAG: ABC transporter permease [Caldisericota bacterium]
MEFLNNFVTQTMVYTTVYTLVALGIVIAGRTGIFNVSGEGVMLAAASSGFITAYLTGNWFLGFLVGALMGAAFGLMLAFIHETFKVNQFILGISLVILGGGLSDLIYKIVIGVRLSAPEAPPTPVVRIPVISNIPIISGFFNQDVIVYFMYAATIVAYWFFYKTKIGLETRAIGENPKAADVVGVNVVGRRYLATIIGSALIGVAGAYLPIAITGTYSPDISAGRGFMAIGIAIFASWKPQRAILGGFLFAAIEVISYQLQLISGNIPYQFFLMLPFVSVLIIMMIFRKQVEFPASVGKPYSRE